uniref:DENN domain containing 2B n=1 Tax=Ursus maritimus TaxID=29073 RepID=A0A452UCZ4_URSMA
MFLFLLDINLGVDYAKSYGNSAYNFSELPSLLLCRALGLQRVEMTMTANKNSSITHGAGGTKAPRGTLSRKSFEFEDASSLQSLYPSSPTENGTESQPKFGSKSTLEENAYEDIVGDLPKENPYEDVDLKSRRAGRKSQQLSENSLDSLHRMWGPQDRKYNNPPAQVTAAPTWASTRATEEPPAAASHDDMLLLAQLRLPSSPSSLNEDSLSTTSELLSSRRARRIPKLVQRINSIYNAKRGKKRLKKLSMSSVETASLRDENSESESDSDDRFKAHTQRLVHIQSMLKRAPSYRTLELELLEWQERELFEYFVVVSLKKKPSRNTYLPEVSYQFPKVSSAHGCQLFFIPHSLPRQYLFQEIFPDT